MLAALESPRFAIWSISGGDVQIHCALHVLQQLRQAAMDGFRRFPHGGLEVGGILFGLRSPAVVRILATSPLKIEYANGPSYVLSENDEAALSALLSNLPNEIQNRGWEVVGWYQSHTRRSTELSARDLALYDRFFGTTGSLCLVLKPDQVQGVETVLHIKGEDGSVLLADFGREASVVDSQPAAAEPEPNAPATVEQPAAAPEAPLEDPQPPAAFQAAVNPAALYTPEPGPTYYQYRGTRRRRKKRYWIPAAALAVCAAALIWFFESRKPATAASRSTPAAFTSGAPSAPAASAPKPPDTAKPPITVIENIGPDDEKAGQPSKKAKRPKHHRRRRRWADE